jgi:autotransporter translocation and assembly factor TamB
VARIKLNRDVGRAFLRRKIWIRTLIALCCAFILFIAAATILTLTERGRLKGYLTTALGERFHADVEIKDITVYVYPNVYLVAHGISARLHGRTDVPPELQMQTLTVSANLRELLAPTKHVSSVHIDGMEITVPPRPLTPPATPEPRRKIQLPLVIDEITADDAKIITLPRDANKQPHEWDIHHLEMNSFSFEQPAHYHATLTNPKPIGEIDSSGEFGPWNAEDPAETPINNGTFSFSHADLDSLKGLGGILSSKGTYSGVLDNLNVEGDTDTPDFSLDVSGNPVHLTTHYVAVVDGTNGDTHLQPVTAHFLHTTVVCRGDVIGIRGKPGKDIELDSVIREGRVEDLLYLAMKSGDKPIMTGDVNLTAKISLPPDPGVKVFDRLGLNGKFGVSGHFTSETVQSKIDSLSRRGQGQPKNEDIENVISNLRGTFTLKDRRANFSNLEFEVQGAALQFSGTYDLAGETLDFHGHVRLDAKPSQMTTGVKSFFLKAVDPFVSKNGVTDLPIKITGTRSHPEFGLDRGHGEEKKGEQGGKD